MELDYAGLEVGIEIGPAIEVGPRVYASPRFIKALSSSEEELVKRIRQLEEGELFKTLVQFGIIATLSIAKPHPHSPILPVQSPDAFDPDQHLDFLEEFIPKKGLPQQTVRQFLSGKISPSRISEFCKCSKKEISQFEQAMRTYHLATIYSDDLRYPKSSYQPLPLPENSTPILLVWVISGKISGIDYGEGAHVKRYLIRKDLLHKPNLPWKPNEIQSLLRELDQVNKVLRTRFDIARRLIQYQRAYIESGDIFKLRCLSQAQLAKLVHKHPSTVLRAVRGRTIAVIRNGDEQLVPLEKLCGRNLMSLIIRTIVDEHITITDREILQIINRNYGKKLTLRTVNYHRTKFQQRRKSRQERKI